ncbi:MAG: OPT/YSL family transporter [Thermofilum sp.]|nr:OPT/YSL family transporter [Thermofilum sp.]
MASQEARAVEVRRGLTLKVLLLAVAVLLLGFYVNLRMWWYRGITTQPLLPGLSLSFLIMLATLPILGRHLFTPQELVTFMAFAPISYIGFMSWAIEPLTLAYWAQTDPKLAKLLDYVPAIWAPRDPKLIEGMIKGGASVPAEIIGPLLLQSLILFSVMLIVIFSAAIFARRFVEVERLGFPAVVPAIEVFRRYEEKTLFKLRENWPFYVGFAAGFAIAIYSTLVYFIPGFPVYFAWGQFWWGDWEKFWKSLNPSISDWWMFVPSLNMLFFIMPLDVAASICIWTGFKSIVWPFIVVGAGWVAPGASPDAGPVNLGYFTFASAFALGFWTLVFALPTLRASLRSLRAKSGEEVLIDKLAWIGFAAGWLIYILIFAALGAHAGFMLMFLILLFLALTGHQRISAETGSWYGPWGFDIARIVTQTTAYASGVPNPWPSTTWWATLASMRIRDEVSQSGGFTPASSIGIWKLAHDTRTSYRDVLIAQLIFAFIYAFIGLFIGVSLLYAYGAENWKTIWYVYGRRRYGIIMANEVPGIVDPGPTYGPKEFSHLLAAFVIVGLVWFMRAKFPWWFFAPVALPFYSGYFFINSMIPVIAKFLILKFLGIKVYERYALPIAVGYMVGSGFGGFIMLTAYAVKP